jgi:hypothetical protein
MREIAAAAMVIVTAMENLQANITIHIMELIIVVPLTRNHTVIHIITSNYKI